MNADPWDLDEHTLAAGGLAATAAYRALTRTAELGNGPPTRVGLMEMYRLTSLTRRIENRLDAGQDALDRGDVDSACLEWAGALVLTDKLAAIESRAKLVHHRHHQKSGSAG
ncbi:MAG: hypothetical protein M3N38_00060 [Pseudomonadota bacterium]|nr:hypothetical protein [Pseudomonadota bacterium]